jgi:hypothetical protein
MRENASFESAGNELLKFDVSASIALLWVTIVGALVFSLGLELKAYATLLQIAML